MKNLPDNLEEVDWSIATWDGAEREQLRRWAELPLASIVHALEEMEEIAKAVGRIEGSEADAKSEPRA